MRKLACFFLYTLLILAGVGSGICDDAGYYSPAVSPSSRYIIDARIDMVKGFLEGRETVLLKNSTRSRIQVVAFDWSVNQLNLKIDREWMEARLKSPFTRQKP